MSNDPSAVTDTTAIPAADSPPAREPARGRAATHGLLVLLVGAWGALVAYAGPAFHYGPAGAQAWQWTTPHTVLNLLPGAGAVAGGLLLTVAGPGVATAFHRLAGMLTLASGAWFVLGRSIYPIFYGTAAPAYGAASGGPLANFVTILGYSLGVGVVLAALGGTLLTISPFRRVVAERSVPVTRRGRLHLRNTDPAAA